MYDALKALLDLFTGVISGGKMRVSLSTDQVLVESSAPIVTAATYSGGLMATYTETRTSDSKTRTITITRNGDNTIATQSATAWA